ncbi:MAG: hypothetical protein JXR91_03680 [Deltaproteobacteria bacterium]|nr:hypothetical protein [Deltaproteobacteria bacterium]
MQKNITLILMFLTLSFVITSCYKSGGSAKDSDSETYANTDSTSNFSTDSDSGSVTDTQTDTGSITDTATNSDIDIDTDIDTNTIADSETETDTDILGCIAGLGTCSCYGDCEDGFGYTMHYPDTEDPGTDNWMSPSLELSEAGIAWYFCSVCGSCGSFTKIKDGDGQWTSVSKKEYCQRIIDVNKECNNCLVTASGGGG